VLLVLAFVIWRLKMPQPERDRATGGTWGAVLKYPHLVFGMVGIFVYVGAEVTIGGHIIGYANAITQISEKSAAVYASLYWGVTMAGRFLGTMILRRFSGGKVLGICGAAALLLILTTMTTGGMLAVWSVVLVGLFNSIMFPTTFALAVAELGPLTGKASGLLMTAAVGGALVPLLQGKLIDTAGYHISFIVPALCYLFIVFYGFKGSRVRTASAS
jgi:MFS transporter, FHS family, L-fucose permease